MKISYNWLREYLNIEGIEINKISEILTNIGLEISGIEQYESVPGGLKGIIIGEVKTCKKHPNADKLSVTTVDIGKPELLPIVCGAPNVAEGQKVVVATVGTTLYDNDEPFQIKKSKIRGEVSEGMICAEDELGLGTSHEGIMVLEPNTKIGTPANEYFNIYNDTILEIDITPNRADAISHFGVARDLYAYLTNSSEQNIELKKPEIKTIENKNNPLNIEVEVLDTKACPRYSGITISGITVKESPSWLKNKLQAIDINPINNIVDITNFVQHEIGQPLHAFDANKIVGNKVIVKTLSENTEFQSLDSSILKLKEKDLMICNTETGMCVAGVIGGLKSGVTDETTSIFLESAYFNSVYVRKTAKAHGISTDSSYRFERGTDPNITVWALKRAVDLIIEIAGGEVSSEIKDVYPTPLENKQITISYSQVTRLIGKEIGQTKVKNILEALDIKVLEENGNDLLIEIPTYRIDVTREADVIEEILRIYGYNNIEIPKIINSTLSYSPMIDNHKLVNTISNFLVSIGFNEIMSNSLTKKDYYENLNTFDNNTLVNILNPLSIDLNVMRQTMLFSGLESINRNINYKNPDLKLFEYGYTYFQNNNGTEFEGKYIEKQQLALLITGQKTDVNWNTPEQKTDFFFLKSDSENILKRLNYNIQKFSITEKESELYNYALEYSFNKKTLLTLGSIKKSILKQFDIEQEVFYAEFQWTEILNTLPKLPKYQTLPKYQEVKRDLALLIDEKIKFEQIKEIAYKTEKKFIKNVSIFDFYKGKNIPEGKKSYAINFVLQNENKMFTDKQINKIMNKLISNYKRQINAEIR